jgi:hypothetical protein
VPHHAMATNAIAKRFYGNCRQHAQARSMQASPGNLATGLAGSGLASAVGSRTVGTGSSPVSFARSSASSRAVAKRLYGQCRQLAECRTSGACKPQAVARAGSEAAGAVGESIGTDVGLGCRRDAGHVGAASGGGKGAQGHGDMLTVSLPGMARYGWGKGAVTCFYVWQAAGLLVLSPSTYNQYPVCHG